MTQYDIAASYRYLVTSEVADYLRMKERKIYDLVRQGGIPCTKVTGKLLFPRESIDLWVMNHLEGDKRTSRPIPPVLAGSHDPLLDWSIRESEANLATLCHGSGNGAQRLLEGDAMVAGMHLLDPVSGSYNHPRHLGLSGMTDLLMIHWALRRQGLLLQPGNPMNIHDLADLQQSSVITAHRQPEAGADALFRWLLEQAGIAYETLNLAEHISLSEDDLALAVREGEATAGLAVEAVARRHGLEFIPLHTERFDLAMRRRSYFEPPVQRLMAFCRSDRFRERASAMGGYDVSGLGSITYNA